MDLDPQSNVSASARAYAWTRSRIIDGTFTGGSMISESDVSNSVGISRTPVREAFLRLAAEGTLKLFPKRGALVISITSQDVRDVMEARLLIEPWAVGMVAVQPYRESLVQQLNSFIDEMRSSVGGRRGLSYQEADRSFHEAIVVATENQLIATFYRSLRDRQLRMGVTALIDNDERVLSILDEHAAIVQAISDGDGGTASRLVRTHVERTRDALADRASRRTTTSDAG